MMWGYTLLRDFIQPNIKHKNKRTHMLLSYGLRTPVYPWIFITTNCHICHNCHIFITDPNCHMSRKQGCFEYPRYIRDWRLESGLVLVWILQFFLIFHIVFSHFMGNLSYVFLTFLFKLGLYKSDPIHSCPIGGWWKKNIIILSEKI